LKCCSALGELTSQMKLAKRSVARIDKRVLSLDASSVIASKKEFIEIQFRST